MASLYFPQYEKFGDRQATSEQILITSKDDRLTITTTTIAPTTSSTSASTSSTPKTTIYSTTTQPIFETQQWMRDFGDRIRWDNNCEYSSPFMTGSTLSNTKEDCAKTCLNYQTCKYFTWNRKTPNKL